MRARHILDRMRGCLEATEIALKDPHPIGYDAANALMQTAFELASTLHRLDAYQRAEEDLKEPSDEPVSEDWQFRRSESRKLDRKNQRYDR